MDARAYRINKQKGLFVYVCVRVCGVVDSIPSYPKGCLPL
jgi:hypothetical protein